MSKPSNEFQGADMAAQEVYNKLIAQGFLSCMKVVDAIMQGDFDKLDFHKSDDKVVKFFTELNNRLNKESNMTTRTTKTSTTKVAKKVTKKAPAKVAKKATAKKAPVKASKAPAASYARKKVSSVKKASVRTK